MRSTSPWLMRWGLPTLLLIAACGDASAPAEPGYDAATAESGPDAAVTMVNGAEMDAASDGGQSDAGEPLPPPPVLTCGPSNCLGCCAGTECVPGSDHEACGGGGNSCITCPLTHSCLLGACEPPVAGCDADSCDGCCSGGTCLAGDSDAACGASGLMCVDCGPAGLCRDGLCEIDPASRWSVIVIDAKVAPLTYSGDAWDPFGGAPDPYVVARVGSPNAVGVSTSAGSDIFALTFNATLLGDLRADTLEAYLRFDVYDDDADTPDWVGGALYTGIPPDAWTGDTQTVTFPASPMVGSSEFTLRWRLERD